MDKRKLSDCVLDKSPRNRRYSHYYYWSFFREKHLGLELGGKFLEEEGNNKKGLAMVTLMMMIIPVSLCSRQKIEGK
jgi:hypothetical protein